MKFQRFYLLGLSLILVVCQAPQQKTVSISEPTSTNKVMDDFFLQAPAEEEAFQVFVSSDEYVLKQVAFGESMELLRDTSDKEAMSEEISDYDMVDLFTEAVYKVELYKDSGLISHIRPVKPSKISEINKIIADDITRLKFKFQDEEKIEPLTFKIRYGIQLRKKKSREEIKKILQENLN